VNDIWKYDKSTIRLLADDCVLYRTILSDNEVENLQIGVSRLSEWTFENEIIIQAKNDTLCSTKARLTESLNYQ
jgi:hypothetical protein